MGRTFGVSSPRTGGSCYAQAGCEIAVQCSRQRFPVFRGSIVVSFVVNSLYFMVRSSCLSWSIPCISWFDRRLFRGRFPDAIPSWFQFWRSAGLLGRPGKPPATVGFQQVPGGGRAAAALEQGAHSLGVGGGAVGIGRGIRAWAAQTRGSSQTGQQAEKSQVEGNPAEGLDPCDQVDERGWTRRFSQ